MPILFMNNFRGTDVYGIELWMLRMAHALRERGHSVWLACRPDDGLGRAAQTQNVPILPYAPTKGLNLGIAHRIRRFVQENHITVICLKTYHDLRLATWACRGLPVRIFCRRGNMKDIRNTLRHYLHIALLRPEILVPSASLKTEFSRISWVHPDRIHVLHHGLDVERYQATDIPSAAKDAIVFLGRLHFDKGIDVLLDAWATVVAQIPHARLVLVGNGDQATYSSQAERLNITSTLTFAGYHSDVRPWLKEATAMVLPSRREGAGYVLIEAMAAGLPVVATRLDCITEYVDEGTTGWLVPPADATALAEALLNLLRDPETSRRMGNAGLQRVREHFSLNATVQRLETIFAKSDSPPEAITIN